jgi:hypothetical protein
MKTYSITLPVKVLPQHLDYDGNPLIFQYWVEPGITVEVESNK